MPRQKFGPEQRPHSPEAKQLAEPLPNTEVATLQGHDGAVLAVRFNKPGTYCLTCGKVRRASCTGACPDHLCMRRLRTYATALPAAFLMWIPYCSEAWSLCSSKHQDPL